MLCIPFQTRAQILVLGGGILLGIPGHFAYTVIGIVLRRIDIFCLVFGRTVDEEAKSRMKSRMVTGVIDKHVLITMMTREI